MCLPFLAQRNRRTHSATREATGAYASLELQAHWKEELLQTWKLAVNSVLIELYAFQQAVDFISKNYFEGHQKLFPAQARDLTEIIMIPRPY